LFEKGGKEITVQKVKERKKEMVLSCHLVSCARETNSMV
jgi:hypothetical protein